MGLIDKDYILIEEDRLNEEFGREVIVEEKTGQTACPYPGCSLDTIYQKSTLPTCPICHGDYWLPVLINHTLKLRIFWRYGEMFNEITGGIVTNGDCVFVATTTNVAKFMLNQDQERYVYADDKRLKILNITPNELKVKYAVACIVEPLVPGE